MLNQIDYMWPSQERRDSRLVLSSLALRLQGRGIWDLGFPLGSMEHEMLMGHGW